MHGGRLCYRPSIDQEFQHSKHAFFKLFSIGDILKRYDRDVQGSLFTFKVQIRRRFLHLRLLVFGHKT